MHPTDRRAASNLQYVGDFEHRQPLPVAQLERDLVVQRHAAQRSQQLTERLIGQQRRRGARANVVKAADRGVQLGEAGLAADLVEQRVTSDPVQVRAWIVDARLLIAPRRQTLGEGALHQIRDIMLGLAGDERRDRIAMPPIQLTARVLVSERPRVEQIGIVDGLRHDAKRSSGTTATIAAAVSDSSLPAPPVPDGIEHRRAIAAAEAALFGGEPEPVRVDRFVVRQRLGQGALGVVYAADDERLQRSVALKLVRPVHADADGDAAQRRWLAEARAMARLRHPNVVTVHEVGSDGPHVFIVMERVQGTTLRVWLAQRPRPWTEILAAFEAAARGLAAAHDAGLVHRDFKPDNVMVEGDGATRVLVTDFGLATATRVQPGQADTTTVEGTPAYMAPEQRQGAACTPATDQFAFCVALFEALFGRRPFDDDVPSDRPYRPAASDDTVPTLLWSIVTRGVSRQPDARWPSMHALLEALRPAPSSRYRVAAVVGLLALLAVLLTGAVLQLKMFWDYQRDARSALGEPP